MNPAPIALFAYRRPDHLRRVLESLAANPEAEHTKLYAFSDGSRSSEQAAAVAEVRTILRNAQGFAEVTVVEQPGNLGLARSIIAGVTEVVNRHDRVIVLEDDLVTSPFFLRYMNEALDLYAGEDRVISVHGYVYPVQEQLPETFFLRGADCWGWATWKRGWRLFNPDGAALYRALDASRAWKLFNFENSYPYQDMLKKQIEGKNDSWAIRWYASAFLAEKLTLYPGRSLICNIGFDGQGTHCGTSSDWDTEMAASPMLISRIPIQQEEAALRAFGKHLRSLCLFPSQSQWHRLARKFGVFP